MNGIVNRRSVVFIATGLALAVKVAHSQEKPEFINADTLSGIGDRLRGVTSELASRFKDRAEGEWIKELGDDIGRLFGFLPKLQVSKFYAEMLDYDVITLSAAIKEDNLQKVTDYIRITHEDIKIKLWGIEIQISRGAASTDVSVEVNTITTYSKKPVNGLQIKFYMLGTGVSGPPFRTFNKLTTPTQSSVPPGYYVIQVLNAKNEVRLERTWAILGQQPEEKIELGIG